jgi:hypothetical protein
MSEKKKVCNKYERDTISFSYTLPVLYRYTHNRIVMKALEIITQCADRAIRALVEK